MAEKNNLPAAYSKESSVQGDTDFVFQTDAITNANSRTQRKISSDYETAFDPSAAKVVNTAFDENFSASESIKSTNTATNTTTFAAMQEQPPPPFQAVMQ